MFGWVGKILRVDLTSGKITEQRTETYTPKFIGGRAMGVKIYWDEVSPEVGAFDPENKLIIMTGPAAGTLTPSAARTSVITKSPSSIPECFMYSHPGGHWGAELKFAGYDGIVVQGRASEPVYLLIENGEVEIRSASNLWGKTTREVDIEIRRIHDTKTKTMLIGPAGENLCRDAVITSGPCAATGLNGGGAIMGSKNLKALAVRGTGAVEVARPRELMNLYYRFTRLITRKPKESEQQHYHRSMQFYTAKLPDSRKPKPIEVPFVDDSALGEEVEKGNAMKRWGACFACPVGCLHGYQFKDGLSGAGCCNYLHNMMEDEWLYRGGKPLGRDSLEFGILCQEFGLSVSQVMGHLEARHGLHGSTWARLLLDSGIWTKENTGLPIDKMGSSEFNREYLRKVAYRQGIGNLIAEGQTRYLERVLEKTQNEKLREKAKEIYEETTHKSEPSYAVHWQMPPSASAKRGGWVWILEITVGARPDHIASFITRPINLIGLTVEQREKLPKLVKKVGIEHFGSEEALNPLTPEGKAALSIYTQHIAIMTDSLPCCRFALPSFYSPYTPDLLGDPTYVSQAFSAVTGINFTEEEMIKNVGERGFNLERAILVREGRRRKNDVAWHDFYFKKLEPWFNKATLREVVDEYYEKRGWDVNSGIPTREKMEELELEDVAKELSKLKADNKPGNRNYY